MPCLKRYNFQHTHQFKPSSHGERLHRCSAETLPSPQTDLIHQLAIDSVKLLNLVMEIEDEFDISVPLNALADVQTVQELANLIHRIKSAQ